MREVLVVGNDFNRQAPSRQAIKRRQRPGGNAIGIDGDRYARLLTRTAGGVGCQFLQVVCQVSAQQPQHFGVLEQQLPGGCQPKRPSAHQQDGADLGLQCAQALRHRRLRDGQPRSGALKAVFLNDGGQAFQRSRIKIVHRGISTQLHISKTDDQSIRSIQ